MLRGHSPAHRRFDNDAAHDVHLRHSQACRHAGKDCSPVLLVYAYERIANQSVSFTRGASKFAMIVFDDLGTASHSAYFRAAKPYRHGHRCGGRQRLTLIAQMSLRLGSSAEYHGLKPGTGARACDLVLPVRRTRECETLIARRLSDCSLRRRHLRRSAPPLRQPLYRPLSAPCRLTRRCPCVSAHGYEPTSRFSR
ncbi:hypothetical protein SAMN05192563_102435 [Paraburkholderia aspalathi]|uniref:Uncharacterized protein n=1 Tax=Paraburkholderia aspalathi TaxID=1324617 RepID=A0A1I7EJA9_9BURK|nr:hypothetical protein SAMN05192563_102435 [Paraburkholderia aspalathi]